MPYDNLFTPYERGTLRTAHRVAMAPLTRNRAKGTVPGELNATYYAQRADAAILITEGTHPAAVGQGYLDIAGLHNDEQQAGWEKVADAVHAAGDAKLFIQLMHCGRVAHPDYTDGATAGRPVGGPPRRPGVHARRHGGLRRAARAGDRGARRPCATSTSTRPAARSPPAPTASSCTPPTATCCTSS